MATEKRKKVDSRGKGGRAERQLVKMFEAWWTPWTFARTPGSGAFATRNTGANYNAQGDIITPDPDFPFCIESKHHEGWILDQLLSAPSCKIYSFWEQTVSETPNHKLPLLLFTKNRAPWYMMIRKSDMKSLKIPMPSTSLTLKHKEHGECIICLATHLFELDPEKIRAALK